MGLNTAYDELHNFGIH